MTANILLARCRDLGVQVAAGSGEKLRVSPPGVLPEDLRQELKQCKRAVLALLQPSTAIPLMLRCQTCGKDARPDGGTLSKDQTNYIQFWRCLSCGAKGSTVFRLQ